MKVITFSKKVTVATKTGGFTSEVPVNPGERYIFDNDTCLNIQQDPGSARYVYEITDLTPLLAEVQKPKHWRKQKVLFYRNRGIGDQLIVSSLSRFFREMLGAESFQLCDRVHEPIWAFNPYIGGAPLSVPIHLDTVWRAKGKPFFDAAFFLESVSEWDCDSEQPNVYDRVFGMVGVDPIQVSAKFKRPIISLQNQDIDTRITWLKNVGKAINKDFEKGYIFIQFRATNKGRSLPVAVIEKVLYVANEIAEKRGIPILCTDDLPFSPEITALIQKTSAAVNVATAINNIRSFAALIAGATLVIGPDSSAIHFAAAFETPAVGIWGPFAPDARTKYYTRQIHLYHQDLCPHSPCFNYLPELPIHKCIRGAAQVHCEVFEGVTTEELFSAIQELLP